MPTQAADAQARARAALELVADPAVLVHKDARPECQGDAALRQQCHALVAWCWALVEAAYGVRPGAEFWSVHRPGDPRNCLTLAASQAEAEGVLAWWAGPAMQVTWVSSADPLPERYVALAVALHWRRPPWLD